VTLPGSVVERRQEKMNMTRRAFFMHPVQAVGEDLENAGEWLRRARRKGSAPSSGCGRTAGTGEQADSNASHAIGLRNARATIRRNDNA
jgi:hypothetical protein